MEKLTVEQARARVLRVIQEVTLSPWDMSDTAKLSSRLDSLDIVEVGMGIEEDLGVSIDDHHMAGWVSVADILDTLRALGVIVPGA